MKYPFLLLCTLAVAAAGPALAGGETPRSLAATPAVPPAEVKRPNILIIVADDLGFSDVGVFGGEIATPNLDALARRGVRLTQFHTAPTCSPTRSMLLTGLDHHQAGVGNMAELVAPNQAGRPGYEGALRPDAVTLAEILGENGYRTHFSGKWHLGARPDQDPHARGFQTSFAMLQGAHNHFGQEVARNGALSSNYTEDGRPLVSLPADFYSSDYLAAKLIDQLKAGRTGADGAKPFFAYLAFTAPHFPLQAPAETIAKYKGRYDAGYDALRAERLRRQVALGLLDARVVPHDLELAAAWDQLTPDDKARAARRMEVYAAMVDRLDQDVGRVVSALRASGEYDDTLIFFLADNGAEGAELDKPAMGPLQQVYAAADNRVENIGYATSYEAIGPGWAGAATAPSWRFKVFQSEGGTRAPAFLSGPGIRPAIGAPYTNVMDVVPTLLDLVQLPRPAGAVGGRRAQPIRGLSWADWLNGRAARVYTAERPVGEELFGGRALRQGDWKIVDVDGSGKWRLFDVAADPGETRDLSAREPARLAALVRAWHDYERDVGVVLPRPAQVILERPVRR